MTVETNEPNLSDDSKDIDYSMSFENVYRRKYQLLLERCEVLEQDNERLINRVRQVENITKKRLKDVRLIKERLDRYGDTYETVTVPETEYTELGVKPLGRIQQTGRGALAKMIKDNKKPIRRKRVVKNDKEKDPNAPKKPCNAFFQFCQEQRPLVVAETTEGLELTKKEVTKQLASRWRALSNDDKKVYVAMFERSKEKYAMEMSAYVRKDQT